MMLPSALVFLLLLREEFRHLTLINAVFATKTTLLIWCPFTVVWRWDNAEGSDEAMNIYILAQTLTIAAP
jgi:4-amino-4-deoxy-L-arabinose transferase-like glycosyltransferase